MTAQLKLGSQRVPPEPLCSVIIFVELLLLPLTTPAELAITVGETLHQSGLALQSEIQVLVVDVNQNEQDGRVIGGFGGCNLVQDPIRALKKLWSMTLRVMLCCSKKRR